MALPQNQTREVELTIERPEDRAATTDGVESSNAFNETMNADGNTIKSNLYQNNSGSPRYLSKMMITTWPSYPANEAWFQVLDGDGNQEWNFRARVDEYPVEPSQQVEIEDGWSIRLTVVNRTLVEGQYHTVTIVREQPE